MRPSRKSVPLISLKDFGSSPFLDHGIFVEAFEDCVSIRQKRMEVHRHDYVELFLLQGRGSGLIDFGTVNKLPIASGVPYHSIIGDRGRGDTPKSSDGVVPYWSSHLDGAAIRTDCSFGSSRSAQYRSDQRSRANPKNVLLGAPRFQKAVESGG